MRAIGLQYAVFEDRVVLVFNFELIMSVIPSHHLGMAESLCLLS
jgi:hypothetical protein